MQEAKKKGKIERRKAHGAKTEFQFEMVLTKDQQAEDELYKEAEEQVGDAKGGAKVGKTEDVPNDVEGDTLEATKEAPGAREAGAEEEGQCQGGEEEAGRGDDIDDVTAAMDALVGCTMEVSAPLRC